MLVQSADLHYLSVSQQNKLSATPSSGKLEQFRQEAEETEQEAQPLDEVEEAREGEA